MKCLVNIWMFCQQWIKITVKIILFLVLLSILMSGNSYAKVWQDSFDDEALDNWERIVKNNPWNAKWEAVEGILFADIRNAGADRPICDEKTADFLHWKIIQFNLEQLTIVGEEITYPQVGKQGMGELCLFIGKRQEAPHLTVEGYIVSPEEVSKVTISEIGKYSRGKTKAWYGNIFQNTTRNLTVVFDSGHFQAYTNDDLIADFIDENLKNIDIVGLLITCHFGGQWFGANISSISISDKAINLAVQLRGTQLTTTWGELKRF